MSKQLLTRGSQCMHKCMHMRWQSHVQHCPKISFSGLEPHGKSSKSPHWEVCSEQLTRLLAPK